MYHFLVICALMVTPPDIQQTKQNRGMRLPRVFLLSFIPFVVFSLGFLPVLFYIKLVLYVLPFHPWIDLLIIPFFVVCGLLLLFVSELVVSGLFIRMFRLRYQEGTYEYSVRDNNAFIWMLVCQLYTPMRKFLEIIPLGGLQRTYLCLLGMKIGQNTLVGGVIKDPCLTEVGDNTTIGEYAVVYAHMHDYEKRTITFQKIRIGKGCTIGAGALLMPGTTIEDQVMVGAGALVVKNTLLTSGKRYGGNPARELSSSSRKTQEDTRGS